MLNTIQARQIAANQPLSEKKITNMKITVTATFTMSGIVWAMKDSIFSIFCSIVFLIAPVEVSLRNPRDNFPICSDSFTRSPYKMRKAATCDAMSDA